MTRKTPDTSEPTGRRCLVVLNPAAGQQDPKKTSRAIEASLADAGLSGELRQTRRAGDCSDWCERAGKDGFDRVVVGGGDGTVAEAAGGLVRGGASIPLAIVPLGTANVIARLLDVPDDIAACVRIAGGEHHRRFDVGHVPSLDHYFLLTVALGLPADIVEDAPRGLKDALGVGAYVWAAARHLWKPTAAEFRFVLDDGEEREAKAHAVLISNMASFNALGKKVAADVTPHDGLFDVYIGEGESAVDFLKAVHAFVTDRQGDREHLVHFKTRRVRVEAAPAVRLQADGEMIGTTPRNIEVCEAALTVMVPETYPLS
jgi:YegS/Rv2252/BmrU family lipid kinase